MFFKVEIATHNKVNNQKPIEKLVKKLLEHEKVIGAKIIRLPSEEFQELNEFKKEVHSISFHPVKSVESKTQCEFLFYMFSDQGPELESIESHENEQVSASLHWILPNKNDFFDLWDSLIYEEGLKEDLLDFAQTMLLFSKKGINQNVISCNRLMLLHGEPGTGKTSLAKAIAQKLSIHMKNTYQFTHLFEINSHSLFSKWFSESGKLVMKMFETIQNVIESGSNLVVVLIDEVESIAYARGSVSTNEPSDAIRVVNSVLTQLDRIKKYPNVLVIATSNLTSSIDPAFLDRADVVRHIGHPTKEAIEKVIESTLMELSMKGIIEPDQKSNHTIEESKKKLTEISQSCVGFSGRALRKLPFLAHALFLKKESSSLAEYLIALKKAVEYQKHSKMIMGLSSKTTTNGIH